MSGSSPVWIYTCFFTLSVVRNRLRPLCVRTHFRVARSASDGRHSTYSPPARACVPVLECAPLSYATWGLLWGMVWRNMLSIFTLRSFPTGARCVTRGLLHQISWELTCKRCTVSNTALLIFHVRWKVAVYYLVELSLQYLYQNDFS